MINQSIGITAIEVALPNAIMTVGDMAKQLGMDADELAAEIGVSQKPILDKNQNITDLAVDAVKQLIKKNNIKVQDIDLII